MEILMGYLVFALATGICSLYELFLPAWGRVSKEKPEALVVNHGILISFLFFIGMTLAAPVAVVACIIPRLGDSFRNAFFLALTAEGE